MEASAYVDAIKNKLELTFGKMTDGKKPFTCKEQGNSTQSIANLDSYCGNWILEMFVEDKLIHLLFIFGHHSWEFPSFGKEKFDIQGLPIVLKCGLFLGNDMDAFSDWISDWSKEDLKQQGKTLNKGMWSTP